MNDKPDRTVQDRQPAPVTEAAPMEAPLPEEPTPEALKARILAEVDREGKYLTFTLAGEEYGIGILKIKEIIGMMPITSVPQTPDFVKGVMEFCENFEMAGQRTQAFVGELKEHDLLMEGEVSIQRTNAEEGAPPFVYRGFKMINQEKFGQISGEQLEKWNKSGLLMLVIAHFLSLDLMRTIFAIQTAQGKGPGAEAEKAKNSKK